MCYDKDIKQIARKYFDEGFNCAESVLLAGVDFWEFDKTNIPRIATPFGGGLSGNGYICGAISGAFMILGLCHGRNDAGEIIQKRKAYNLADDLLKDFKERFGAVNCKELSHVDFKTEAGVKEYRDRVHTQVCVPIVEFTSHWLAERITCGGAATSKY